ncbi:MAG: integrase core domain-containing protein, partial [Coprobacillaceae bacterium]
MTELHIPQSFSAPATPYDNAVIEGFFSSLKREQLYIKEINSFDDLINNVQEYITYYNQMRPHKTLKYKNPNQVEMEFEKSK